MRFTLFALLLAAPVVAADPKPPTPAEVKKEVDAGKAVLIDVRSQEEWDAGHLKAAKFLPVTRITGGVPKAELIELMPAGKTVYLHCMGPGRCVKAEAALTKLGYKVQAVPAGYKALAAAGLEKAEAAKK